MEGSNSSLRLSIDEHMAGNSSAEQAMDEEIVARSGDPGMLDSYQVSDPWSTGEIEYLERKWLQQELRDRTGRDTGSFRSSPGRVASLERMGSVTSSRFSQARSSRSSCRSSADQQIFEIGQTAGNAASSTSQMGSLENELERVSADPAIALSPLSDSPLFPESSLREPLEGLAPQLSASHLRPRDRLTKEGRCHHSLEYIGTLAHLACFGIIGVLIRYGLEVLFADVLSITREGTIIYRDLPANVVGSFFMGWVGIVLKKDILFFSEPLAIGLSTGLMGSITTYAAWNQKMVALLTTGNIVAAFSGLVLGMAIAQLSLLAGIDSAKGLKWAIGKLQQHGVKNEVKGIRRLSPDNNRRRMVSFMVFAFTTVCLWGAALALLIKGGSPQKVRILWLACIVAPPGVWSRWHLARFNGKGLGGRLKWLPVGTLLANLLAATLEAVLSFLQFVVTDDSAPLLIGGLQLGFLGCLSTVSTFVAEVYTMHVGPMKSKAYVYTFTTLVLGLVLGIMLYSCPAWTKGYAKW